MRFNRLMLEQLDDQLKKWAKLKNYPTPKRGWVNLIRTTLGLSSYQLAKRIGVYQSRIIQIETAELNKAVTLKTLEKTAEAMGCKLVYALVPKTSLQNILEQQAKKLASQQLARVSHSMELEAQGINPTKQKRLYKKLVQELLEDKPNKLWNTKQ